MRSAIVIAAALVTSSPAAVAETFVPDPLEATVLARVERSRQVSWCILGVGTNLWRGEAVVERILEPSMDQGRPQPLPRRFEFESGGWCSGRGKPDRNASYVFLIGPVEKWHAYGFMSVETYRQFKTQMERVEDEVRRSLAQPQTVRP